MTSNTAFPTLWRLSKPYWRKVGELSLAIAKIVCKDVSPKYRILTIPKKSIGDSLFVAPTSKIDSSAVLGKKSSVWFHAKVGANVKIGNGACIMDGAIIEDNCILGDACVVKQGAVVKKGTKLGSRVVVGMGGVVPEGSDVKDFTILVDGWNGTTVKDSTTSEIEAEEEAVYVMKLAELQHNSWSLTAEEREKSLQNIKDDLFDTGKMFEKHPTWDTYVQQDPNPRKNPERRGLIFDKQ